MAFSTLCNFPPISGKGHTSPSWAQRDTQLKYVWREFRAPLIKSCLALQDCRDDNESTRMDYGPSHSLKGVRVLLCRGSDLCRCQGSILYSSTSLGEGCGSEHLAPPDSQFPRPTDLRGYSDSSSSPELEKQKNGIKPLCLSPFSQLGDAFSGYNIAKSRAWCLA